jgi:GNAT superfamily N-acetyltransferase
MQLRSARSEDEPFVLEMARLACTLEDRPVPPRDAPGVLALLPEAGDAVVATDEDGRLLGAAWWHCHDPPLLRGAAGEPLPELAMAVLAEERRQGVGAALVEALAAEAGTRFGALALNVHLRNPAVRLYMRTGFTVAGAGRGPFGVAMIRVLDRP